MEPDLKHSQDFIVIRPKVMQLNLANRAIIDLRILKLANGMALAI